MVTAQGQLAGGQEQLQPGLRQKEACACSARTAGLQGANKPEWGANSGPPTSVTRPLLRHQGPQHQAAEWLLDSGPMAMEGLSFQKH